MSPFATLLHTLLREGRVELCHLLQPGPDQVEETVTVLRQAHEDQQLDVAGPPLDFAPATALAAAGLVFQACWALISLDAPPEELQRSLVMPAPPHSPAEHLSADLTLRFLAQVHRRARRQDPGDVLPTLLAQVLRQWPLSGVLSEVEEGPLTALDFGGHPGLLLLYAERLVRNEKPAWFPQGRALEYVELVWSESGKDVTALRRGAASSAALAK